MDQDLQNIEIILRYLDGKMSEAEQREFVDKMNSDEGLKAEVNHYRKAKQGFDTLKAEAFQKNLDLWESEVKTSSKAGPDNVRDINAPKGRLGRGIFPLLAMAASLVATVLIFWFMLQPSGVLNVEEILASYTPEHKMPMVRDAGGTEHRLKEGIIAYTENRFAEASGYFGSIPQTDPQYIDAQMYLGYSRFEEKQFSRAIAAFETVKQSGSPRFADKADWFAALSRLASGNEEKWMADLSRIAQDPGHQFNKEAREILESMD